VQKEEEKEILISKGAPFRFKDKEPEPLLTSKERRRLRRQDSKPVESCNPDRELISASVPNPESGKKPNVDVKINIRNNSLEAEYRKNRITFFEYIAGKLYGGYLYQDYEKENFLFTERVQTFSYMRDYNMLWNIHDAKMVEGMRTEARSIIGSDREYILYKIIYDELSISDVAAKYYGLGNHNLTFVGKTFRASLKLLSNEWFLT